MHLLATTSGVVDGGAEAIDLKQPPGDIVVLTSADSEIAALARAADSLGENGLRLASLLQLQHNYSVDLYIEKTLSQARLVVLRLLGGASYWTYGLDQTVAVAQAQGIKLAVLPGEAGADPALTSRSTLPAANCEHLRRYLAGGGAHNAENFLSYCCHLLDGLEAPPPAQPLAVAGIHRRIESDGQLALILFYRSVVEGGLAAPIEALADTLATRGMSVLSFYVASLKDAESVALLRAALGEAKPSVILNATSFAASSGMMADPLAEYDCPVLQVVLAGTSQSAWQASTQGLGARDLAMNVVLPELDGRIHSRAISFKADSQWHGRTYCRIVTHQPIPDRVNFVADLAANWLRLRQTPARDRRVAIILANYPDKAGRIANGVGYDTPASTIAMLKALAGAGYDVRDVPESGNTLVEALQEARFPSSSPLGETPHPPIASQRAPPSPSGRGVMVALAAYRRYFAALPETVRVQMIERWGDPASDPWVRDGEFHLPVCIHGNVAVAIQPSRGYNIDPKATYHDPALVPPHCYLAFYVWLRQHFGAHALIHNGKHGNLEWLPGKATALSDACYPEIAHGPLPQLYPFIVNDPGEGTQAKRRTGAVIIDHLTPPLTRAETYGPLKDLEALIDEYYLASGLDRRRVGALRRDILDLVRGERLDLDAGLTGDSDTDLQKIDAYLCDLKEAQIRDGLHVLGSSPEGRLETDLLVALTRVPRGLGEGSDASLIRALAHDLDFGDFDPLACDMAKPWMGPRPSELEGICDDPWRTNGDTIERLELLAASLLSHGARKGPIAEQWEGDGFSFASYGTKSPYPPVACGDGPLFLPMGEAKEVLDFIETTLRPTLRSCGPQEIAALLAGLDGRRVAPGPSGAPTRGRADVLPTGRNFYSLDNRTLPTPTAWTLGRRSAEDLLMRHFQDTGQYPKAIGLSVWGTANMRTGGDDIAQALALIGARPVWEPASWRVTGFEIVPVAVLGRPRVDVTLRISGFFRDAFPAQIELLDKAMRAVGALDETEEDNPMAARMTGEARSLAASGFDQETARELAGFRIFGSKPGAYGAGLQVLIDERIWKSRGDLAAAYVTWGAYAYGARAQGRNDEASFRRRLANVEAVIHNQDNREHDLFDSDDYYQFEGGMTAAVEQASGARPRVYHNDHSRPDRPVIRTLEEEVGRVMRSRVVNPKWIAGVKRHGYKGAFEIAATVDYMFAFAATTGAVKNHHFDMAYDAYLGDEGTRQFLAANNPAALREIAERFDEAMTRGLWMPRLNSTHHLLQELMR